MDIRRDFLKKAMLLSGAAGVASVLPESIQSAMAIDPKKGSTYLDAEHIVILMQENRSFDHCFGTLQGVRGFNDPRAITLPDKNLVRMQTNNAGETYTPFRFDIRNTKATWMGSTPHSRSSQVDANNLGRYDQWLQSKLVWDKRYADSPLTLGYYNRQDIPIYNAMADVFTIGDHNVCSAMTSTNPNRLFLWTGTISEQQNGQSALHFDTFPERLEDNGISWKFYQNDIDCGGGFSRDERAWLANFGCNPLEWFANYNVRFSSRYIQGLENQIATLPNEIKELEQKLQSTPVIDASFVKMQTAIAKKKEVLDKARKEVIDLSRENYDKSSAKEKSLYQSAFTIDSGDPYYHEVTTLSYEENGEKRSLSVPKGDVLDQFRKDVEAGQLPTVSWLSAAQNFSDHPRVRWYGSLYLSEILNILTQNPEVWKNTIFLVTFDENDGYFDHVPPYVAPDPFDPSIGKCSPGIDTDVEYIRLESELNAGILKREARGGPIGLGFRKVLTYKWFFLMLIFFHGNIWGQTLCVPVDLQCEYQAHPLVIDQQNPRLSWKLKDSRKGAAQTGYQIMVASDSTLLKNGKPDIWNTGKINSSQSNAIHYQGKPLTSRRQYYWQVIVWDKDGGKSIPSVIGKWETGMFQITDWKGSWISDGKDTSFEAAPYFLKDFDLHGKIKSARLYICGLGYYELHLNGQKVGDRVLDPGYTRFDKTNLYAAYDLTSQLKQGKNALGVILGNGWFNEQSQAVWYFHKAPWRGRPQLLLNLFVEYTDGRMQTIVSDTSWKVSTGPIVFNNIYSGEYQDNRLQQKGWDKPGFDNSSWPKARLVSSPGGELRGQLMPPIRIKKEIKPVSIRKFNDTTYLFDMGQNFAGWSRLTVSGKRGTVIHIKHGEVLYPDGRLNIQRISEHYRFTDTTEKAQTDRFILNGNGTETFQQHFNYHGYQYIEVTTNIPINLNINSITGLFMHTDVKEAGHFSCSDTLMNKIYDAGIWSYLSNLYSIPTDCPHREKNGWTADGLFGAETGLFNFDGILLYEKWIGDFIDEQRESGELPGIIPTSGWGYQWGNGPAWDAAIMIVPWYIYLYYGDATLINKYYKNYKKYVDYLTFRSENYLVNIGLGDWSPYKTQTPVELTSSCYYYTDAHLLSLFAKLHGQIDDAAHYAKLANKIREAINRKYFNSKTMTYANGSQTALSAALYQKIVPDNLCNSIAENLANAVKQNDNHLDVGLLGSKYLLNALSDNGYGDLAFKVASQRTKPSWGWWILQGMTTYQESWDLGPSRNHIMYGEIVAWMFKDLAGIQPDPDLPGFKNIILKPDFVNDLTHAEATHETVYGVIRSSWEKTTDGVIYNVEIPANSMATLYLAGKKLFENNDLVNSNNKYIHFIKNENGRMVYNIVAGKYEFKIK